MSEPVHDLIVVGAGAAGLWAAARAAELGRRVLLVEKTRRAGTKVLASGGTRCNLTTTHDPDTAARLFGRGGERFLRPALRALPPEAVRARFAELGVETVEAPLDKVFPASQSARDVRDALQRAATAAGVELRCGAAVRRVEPAEGGWLLELEEGGALRARSCFLAPGGRSYPSTGTTGDGYRWLEELQLEVVAPVPALVPLASPAEWVHELTGLARQGARVRLLDHEGKELARRERPLLFTHFGLSGPAAMDVSGHVARRIQQGFPNDFTLLLDLVPELGPEELRAALIRGASQPGRPRLGKVVANLSDEPLPRRLVGEVLRQAGVREGCAAAELSRSERHALVETLSALRIPVDGTRGWDKAEVTRGGLSLRALNPRTMEVNGHRGLYVFGELLDLDGPIGGLNFQAAFATAELAARAAGSSSQER